MFVRNALSKQMIHPTHKQIMILILSPAKTLDLSEVSLSSIVSDHTSYPSCELDKTGQLVDILKSKSQKQLKDMLGISDKISSSVKKYYEEFDVSFLKKGESKEKDEDKKISSLVKPAIYSFDGAAYKGIDSTSCNDDTILHMQNCLRIIDPLYGVLKPLDYIQPYRLEMATKKFILKDLNTDEKSLANWWKDSITSNIISSLKEEEEEKNGGSVVLNLASDEYSSALDTKKLGDAQCKFIKVAFQQEGRVIAVHAKRARGLMTRYVCENQIENAADVKNFDLEGYQFCEDKSDDLTFVFDRSKNWKDQVDVKGSGSKKRKTKEEASTNKKRKAVSRKKK